MSIFPKASSPRLWLSALAVAALVGAAACGGSTVSPSSTATTTSTTPDTLIVTGALAYDPDIKAILGADCVRCHGSSGGYSAGSYAAVMTAVTPGSASSRLVTVTQSGGSMYRYWSGDAAARADMVRRWVVTYSAAATR